jgi:hypothetical protein
MRIGARILRAALAAATTAVVAACGEDDADGTASTAGVAEAPASSSAMHGGSGSSGNSSTGAGGGGTLWHPAIGTTWQWQLAGLPIDTSFDVAAYDVDLFTTTDDELATLHADGRKVICYFDAGSWEDSRPDAADFPAAVKGNLLDPPFQDELWLDVRRAEVRALMKLRLDLAEARGCDGVEPDNVDGYANDNGFALTAANQLDYNRFIAGEAHARSLSVGLKNDVDQLADLEPDFDWALNEECVKHKECAHYRDNFLVAQKAVFHAEYVDQSQLARVCAVTKPLGLSTLIKSKSMELDAFQLPCP